ncbi:MAG: LacI family DNA-binding transcriptional regulator [Cypionkella sp.]
MSKVTLRVIADQVGLSTYAVSRALSGKPGVSTATRVKVGEVAERLGYRRAGAPDLQVIGAVFDDSSEVNGELYMQIQSGAQREASRLGYSIRVHWTHHPDDLEVIARECAALLIVGQPTANSLKRACATGIPIVRSGWQEPLEQVDAVGGTDREAGAAVGQMLLDLGHTEFVYAHGEDTLRGRRERLWGMRSALESVPGAKIKDLVWPPESGFTAALDAWLATGARPTAFFCSHDGIALTVISDLLARGWRIPEDASVVGFGDYSAAQQIRPALTTVKVFGVEFGVMGVRRLDSRLRNPDLEMRPLRLQIPNQIIKRKSVGPAPAASTPANPKV